MRTKLLFKIVVCPLPGTGSPEFFMDTCSTEVPFSTLSECFPLERARQTGKTTKTSGSSRMLTFVYLIHPTSLIRRYTSTVTLRSKDVSSNFWYKNNCTFSQKLANRVSLLLNFLHQSQKDKLKCKEHKYWRRLNDFYSLMNRPSCNTSQMFVPSLNLTLLLCGLHAREQIIKPFKLCFDHAELRGCLCEGHLLTCGSITETTSKWEGAPSIWQSQLAKCQLVRDVNPLFLNDITEKKFKMKKLAENWLVLWLKSTKRVIHAGISHFILTRYGTFVPYYGYVTLWKTHQISFFQSQKVIKETKAVTLQTCVFQSTVQFLTFSKFSQLAFFSDGKTHKKENYCFLCMLMEVFRCRPKKVYGMTITDKFRVEQTRFWHFSLFHGD